MAGDAWFVHAQFTTKLCSQHPHVLWNTGAPMKINDNDQERFWAKVDTRGADACWPWTGYCLPKGYGRFGLNGRVELAHRVSFLIQHGRDPIACVCHSCDNPKCVNPSHLFEGTTLDNVRDKVEKGRGNHGSRHGNSKLTDAVVRGIYKDQRVFREIAVEFEVSESVVHRIKVGKAWRHLGLKDKGRLTRTKLTDKDVLAIRSDMRSNRDIASGYGVSASNIAAIKRRLTWRHIK